MGGFQYAMVLTAAQVKGLEEAYYELQNERHVYPTLAAGASIASANTNWVYGNYAVVVPANTIATPFHVVAVSIES